MHKSILVTGGAGFAGAALCVRLAQEFGGVKITALDNLKRRGSERNLGRLRAVGVGFEHADVRHLSDLLSIRPEPDLIIECSAEPSAQSGYNGSPQYVVETNLAGCFHCLELARITKADFLFISTSRVYPYGLLNALPFTEEETRFSLSDSQNLRGVSVRGVREDFPMEGARSLYGMTKLAAELMVEEFADAYGFRYVIDRFGLLTGPYQMAKSDQGVIALWAAAHHFARPLSYIGFGGAGKQVRDFLHVDDFCDLIVDQIRSFDLYKGARWNAGGGRAYSLSLQEATRLCQELTGNVVSIGSVAENRPADVRIYLTDHHAVSSVNGWRPGRDARVTISDILTWLRSESEDFARVLFP